MYGPACDVTSSVNVSSLVVTVPIVLLTPSTSCPLESIHCTEGVTNRYSTTATVQVRVEDCPEVIMREEGVMVTLGNGRAVEEVDKVQSKHIKIQHTDTKQQVYYRMN